MKFEKKEVTKIDKYTNQYSSNLQKKLHFCIEKVTKSLDNFQYNVAVAALREFANHFFTYKQEYNDSNLLHKVLSKWVIMISPLAPHLAEELWKILGYKSLVAEQKWPKYEDKFLTEDNINLIVQINGKKKLLMNIKKGLTEEQTKKLVLENTSIKEILKNRNYKKIIIIPNRVANLVI